MKIIPIKRALISVSDKAGIKEFAKELHQLGVEIISTGGTSKALHDAGISHLQAEDITGMPEMLDGRVKTLHPRIHGGILGLRDEHAEEASQQNIPWIDLVVVNFYPFENAVKPEMEWHEVVEYIDIGGPTMVRAAGKNFAWVGVVTQPNDYATVIKEIKEQGGLTYATRKTLAGKAFSLTSSYDGMIKRFFTSKDAAQESCPPQVDIHFEKVNDLRYGENPHQKAGAYRIKQASSGILSANQHQGKALSYNNLVDAEAAWACVQDFDQPACVIVKHANPCGVAVADTIEVAYQQALAADPVSAFGGIVALNRPCSLDLAKSITAIFMEVVIAPAFSDEALAELATKPNLRVLKLDLADKPRDDRIDHRHWEMKFINGGMLLQEKDTEIVGANDLTVVTAKAPTAKEIDEMLFAWRVIKHIKSNGILLTKEKTTIGIGAGQVSRIDSVDIALRKAGEKIQGAVLASDAFFPFRDSIDKLAKTGITTIIQPGGSLRDEEVIAACNEHGIAMVFTGKRCFRH